MSKKEYAFEMDVQHVVEPVRELHIEEGAFQVEDLRMAYRILRNAGYVPEEVKSLSIGEKKLALLKARVESRYFSRVAGKLER